MKPIKSWNMGIFPLELDFQNEESIDKFQRYMDISSVLQACTDQVSDTECTKEDGTGLLRIMLTEKVSPVLLSQFYRLAEKPYSYIHDPAEREIDFITTVMELVTSDVLCQIELHFEDESYELRTFENIEPDMDISCLYIGEDMSLVDLRTLNEGLGSIDYEAPSSFIAVRYKTRHVSSSKQRLPTGFLGVERKPITAFAYVEHFANWFETF